VREGRENNFHQSHTSWLTLPGLSAVVRGLDVPGRKLIPNRTPRKVISPISYFMANSGLDFHAQLSPRCLTLAREDRMCP